MLLKKGDIVDVICPASSASLAEFKKIELFLKKYDLKARFFMEKELLLTTKPKNSLPQFSAKKRFEQLLFALENKESRAVWCIRGGYGSSELIPFLEKSKKIVQNKIFIGFSDITSLAIFLNQKWNWKIIYGPMLTQLAFDKLSKKSEEEIFKLVFSIDIVKFVIASKAKQSGKSRDGLLRLKPRNDENEKINVLNQTIYKLSQLNNFKQKISAKIVGGCLSIICASLATSNQIDVRNNILFLEDIDESAEKIDRYFTQILQFIKSQNQIPQAILLGNFYQNVDEKNKKNIDFVLKNFAKKIVENNLEIPLFVEKTKCLGHSKNMLSLIVGSETIIENNFLIQ